MPLRPRLQQYITIVAVELSLAMKRKLIYFRVDSNECQFLAQSEPALPGAGGDHQDSGQLGSAHESAKSEHDRRSACHTLHET